MESNPSKKKEIAYKNIINHAPVMISLIDNQGNILYTNDTFQIVSGYSSKELSGENFRKFLSTEYLSDYSDDWLMKMNLNKMDKSEIIIQTKSGKLIPVEISFEKHDNSSDQIICYLYDITEKTKLLERLKTTETELELKNDELDSFAHTVAHDLKNPLGTLLGFNDILFKEYENLSQDQIIEVVRCIRNSGFRIQNIIKELLLLSEVNKENIQTEKINMNDILKEVQIRIEDMLVRNNAELILVKDMPEVLGYAPWIEEVWINFIGNAIKFGGHPPFVEIGFDELPDKKILFWVKDNGAGISAEKQKNLFVPFTRLQVVRAEGHGLGLSISRTIIEKLNGEVGVESTSGKGSKFYFILSAA